MKCPNCGSDNAPGSRFCYNCGTSLAAAAATETPPAPATPDLAKKPSEAPPPAQPPVERTVVMSLPPNMFPPPPPNVPPATPPASNMPPGGATQASDFPPYGATQAADIPAYGAAQPSDVTMPPYAPPPPTPSSTPAGAAPATGVKRSGMALAALICGILALTVVCSFGIIMPLVAIVLGFVARGQISKSAGTLTGGGMAIAGIVLGFFGLIINALVYVFSILPLIAALGGA